MKKLILFVLLITVNKCFSSGTQGSPMSINSSIFDNYSIFCNNKVFTHNQMPIDIGAYIINPNPNASVTFYLKKNVQSMPAAQCYELTSQLYSSIQTFGNNTPGVTTTQITSLDIRNLSAGDYTLLAMVDFVDGNINSGLIGCGAVFKKFYAALNYATISFTILENQAQLTTIPLQCALNGQSINLNNYVSGGGANVFSSTDATINNNTIDINSIGALTAYKNISYSVINTNNGCPKTLNSSFGVVPVLQTQYPDMGDVCNTNTYIKLNEGSTTPDNLACKGVFTGIGSAASSVQYSLTGYSGKGKGYYFNPSLVGNGLHKIAYKVDSIYSTWRGEWLNPYCNVPKDTFTVNVGSAPVTPIVLHKGNIINGNCPSNVFIKRGVNSEFVIQNPVASIFYDWYLGSTLIYTGETLTVNYLNPIKKNYKVNARNSFCGSNYLNFTTNAIGAPEDNFLNPSSAFYVAFDNLDCKKDSFLVKLRIFTQSGIEGNYISGGLYNGATYNCGLHNYFVAYKFYNHSNDSLLFEGDSLLLTEKNNLFNKDIDIDVVPVFRFVMNSTSKNGAYRYDIEGDKHIILARKTPPIPAPLVGSVLPYGSYSLFGGLITGPQFKKPLCSISATYGIVNETLNNTINWYAANNLSIIYTTGDSLLVSNYSNIDTLISMYAVNETPSGCVSKPAKIDFDFHHIPNSILTTSIPSGTCVFNNSVLIPFMDTSYFSNFNNANRLYKTIIHNGVQIGDSIVLDFDTLVNNLNVKIQAIDAFRYLPVGLPPQDLFCESTISNLNFKLKSLPPFIDSSYNTINKSKLLVCGNSNESVYIKSPLATDGYMWYTAPVGGIVFGPSNIYSFSSLSPDTGYRSIYVATDNGTCLSDRKEVQVYSLKTPSATLITNILDSACTFPNLYLQPKSDSSYFSNYTGYNPTRFFEYTLNTNPTTTTEDSLLLSFSAGTVANLDIATVNRYWPCGVGNTCDLNRVCKSPIKPYLYKLKPNDPTLDSSYNNVTNSTLLVCGGSNQPVNVKNPISGFSYNWYATTTGNNVSVGNNYNFSTLSPDTGYRTIYLAANNGVCVSDRREVKVLSLKRPVTPIIANIITNSCTADNVYLQASSSSSYFLNYTTYIPDRYYNYNLNGTTGVTTDSLLLNYTGVNTALLNISSVNRYSPCGSGIACDLNRVCESSTATYNYNLAPISVFSLLPSNVNAGGLIHFTNSSSNYKSVYWDFGDGSSSVENNPFHYYYHNGNHNVALITTSTNGCIDSAIINNAVTVTGGYVGLVAMDNSFGVIMYPNPTDGILTINLTNNKEQEIEISLIDMLGRKTNILNQNMYLGKSVNSVDLSSHNFTPGVYIISINNSIYSTNKIILR